ASLHFHSFPTRRSSDLASWALMYFLACSIAGEPAGRGPIATSWRRCSQARDESKRGGAGGWRAIASARKHLTISAPLLSQDVVRSEEHTSELQSRGHLV